MLKENQICVVYWTVSKFRNFDTILSRVLDIYHIYFMLVFSFNSSRLETIVSI